MIRDRLQAIKGLSLARAHNLVFKTKMLLNQADAVDDDLTYIMLMRLNASSYKDAVNKATQRINAELGTEYKAQSYYSWMNRNLRVPGTVRRVMMRDLMLWLCATKEEAEQFSLFWE